MNKKLFVLIPIIVLLVSSSTVTAAANAQEVNETIEKQQQALAHYYDLGNKLKIHILYNEYQQLSKATADSIFGSLSLLTPNVEMVHVQSKSDLFASIKEQPDIAIYTFESDHENLILYNKHRSEDNIGWREMADFLMRQGGDTQHIFAMGNTAQLLSHTFLVNNIHGPGQQVIDAQHSFMFAMWELSEILSSHPGAYNLSEDIKHASLQYFADNFNELVSNNLQPDNPMGVEDPLTKQERVDRFYEQHPASYKRIAQEGNYIDEVTGLEIDGKTGDVVSYDFDIYNSASVDETKLTATDFIVNLLPEESGLRGPIGGIVDELLGFLLSEIGDLIGLSGETLESLANALFAIPDFIGAFADPSASKIKNFLDKLKPMIPLPADKLDYFDMLVDALFLLRGSPSDIKNFLLGAIEKVVPDLGGDDTLVTLLSGIFELGTDIYTGLSDGDKFIDVVFSTMNEQIVSDLLGKYLNNSTLFGIDIAQLPEVISRTIGTVKAIINTVATGDFKTLAQEYLPQALSEFDSINALLDSDEADLLGLFVSIVLAGTGALDTETISSMLELFLIKMTNMDVAHAKNIVERVVNVMTAIVETPTTSPDTILNELQAGFTALGYNTAPYSDELNALKEIISIVLELKVPSFSTASTLLSSITTLLNGFGVSGSNVDVVMEVVNSILAVVSIVQNPPNLQNLLTGYLSNFNLESLVDKVLTFMLETVGGESLYPSSAIELNALSSEGQQAVDDISEAVALILDVIQSTDDNSVEGIMMALLQGGAYVLTQITDVDVMAYVDMAKNIFGTVLGYFDSPPSLQDVLTDVLPYFAGSGFEGTAESIATFLVEIQGIFTGGFKSVFAKVAEWLAGQVTQLIESVTGEFTSILDKEEWPLLEISIPIGLGSFSLFDINIGLGLKPGFEFNEETFYGMIFDLVFKGVSIFSGDANAGDVLRTALSFLSIHPIFIASLELDGFGSGESSFVDFMLSALGLELSFSGSGFFELSLFSFKNGVFNFDDFFKVLAWGFEFTLTLSRTFTLLDFLTGGAAGSLNSIGKYIGLDAISITIGFTIGLEVIKRAATANAPETGSLTVTLTIFFTVSLGINILIAKLILTGTLEITLTLLQDLVEPTPLRVFISVVLIITVTIGFLFWDWDFHIEWSPDGFAPDDPYELTPKTQAEADESGALGADFDGDGLSNEYEDNTPGLDKNSVDSDGDGLSDKFETQTLKTDPTSEDTDGDGLHDDTEVDIGTNPLAIDSDFDRLTDYEEVMIYGTDAMEMDTDGDLLDDYYEINTSYNMTGIWRTAPSVTYAGVTYTDRTDVLNPDSDFDGLIDGNEGENGVYYGPELSDPSEEVSYTPDQPLIFNGGYTHPLSNDTDKDSYEQLYDGSISPRKRFLRDMSDYTEIHGITAVFIDPDTGIPQAPRVLYTNPTNPDSDGDTGVKPEQRENPPAIFFLNSDGYELALDPPTDPLDGDSDDDGLIDGFEGILRPDANHTDALNPDTDGDGLNDMVERELGSDARLVDTDGDGVTDGDEFFIFGTNPFLDDTDGDGLTDGDELWTYHSNPHLRDTDNDKISDYKEVWVYFSDPSDEDSDNDGLTDYEEIIIHYTDPFTQDTDGDGLFDGDEVKGLNYTYHYNGTDYWVLVFTDPLKWDTDNDSLLTRDQDGEISMSMSDGDEWKYKTRPDRMDTDGDGIQDGWELWLGKGKIPGMDPIKVNPLLEDTDGDGLKDGQELSVANVSTLLYPYVGFVLNTPYNTSAVSNDTDGDSISDTEELLMGTFPDNVDSDNDTIGDYQELEVYFTNPAKNDTDGDGIIDPVEINGYYLPPGHSGYDGNLTLILTDPNKLDSDGDLLPDKAEIDFYNKDPTNPDQNGDGILDGMEIDTDGDGLQDGEEYFVYMTTLSGEGGGPFQPDSDKDGLFDGQEIYESYTEADDWDSDNDTYSDGLEWACGTDPNNNETTDADFQSCFDQLARLVVLSPVPGKTYETNVIPVVAYDPDDVITSMEFSYKYGANFSQTSLTVDMQKDVDRGAGYWKAPDGFSFALSNGSYLLEIRADRGGEIITREIGFKIQSNPDQLEIRSPINGKTYRFNVFNQTSVELPIEVKAGSSYTDLWFTIYNENGTILAGSNNATIPYEGGRQSNYIPAFAFPNLDGTHKYALIVYANQTNGQVVAVSSLFSIRTPTAAETFVTVAGPVIGAAVIVTVVRRAGFKNPFKKGGNN